MKNINFRKVVLVVKYLMIYYLSAKMICFAIPKFFFMQFRILHWESYLPLVEISKSLHMWSFFGRSYNYNIFIGLAEFMIGALVVFKRTRLIALLISAGVCSNIIILNIEFDIVFAIQHVLLDFAITLILLSAYSKDLYHFFIELGGKFHRSKPIEKLSSYKVYLPFLFILVLSVSYSIFAYTLKSTVYKDIVGTYEIRSLHLNEDDIPLSKGKLGSQPMMFFEHNNQVVLSVNEELYFGYYYVDRDTLKFSYKDPAGSGIQTAKGLISTNSLEGTLNEEIPFRFMFQRVDGKKNYLNDLYK
ncbi:hypothetical protein [Litoribacter populi]|uniref:hypothetical protein n=1 Tax=Litoribacter populi TaxID=2598460 RepID=UPI00117D555A|nr:hypothetical protein [Litoribacter populi]